MRIYRILLILIVICGGLAGLTIGLRSCASPVALVHLWFPEDYTYEGSAVLRGDGFASLELSPGIQVLHFTHAERIYVAVVNIHDGGEIYETLTNGDIHPVKDLKEMRYSDAPP